MLRLNVTLSAASPLNAENLLEGLQYQAPGTRLEQGCLGCGAWLAADATVRYSEDWATEEDLRRRVQSERFTSLLAVVEAAADAQVQFDFVNQTRGLDYVVELREGSATKTSRVSPKSPSEPGR
jgi:quinol monooxygenase YgiN